MAEQIPEDIMQAAEDIIASAQSQITIEKIERAVDGQKMIRDVYVTEIARAIVADRQRDQWQPIETAEKNGLPVYLAWNPEDWTTGEGFYRDGKWVVVATYYSRHHKDPPYEMRELIVTPVMWHPLPDAPKGGAT
ncbi:hypothetical protein LH464_21515 [Neorhizobium sp. T786]|uniref:hypothetical protein n=1 Tax=Pseudorhizobium xiangyangii TaxID=2883104 RepID=UPI001CFFBDE5|nr:hypothetical protein [Neorhizobium xiangyangii]MCB5205048.1 hypothetical protein [Neorhizobium xiangyangii]